MENYRITFLHSAECDYWGKNRRKLQAESFPNFEEFARKHYKHVSVCKLILESYGIKYFWHFYEPFIEVTWLSDNRELSDKVFADIETYLEGARIHDYRRHYPENGKFADWFCRSEREREFGAKVHALCGQWVDLYKEYEKDVDSGMGVRAQVGRTVHRLCNPLGLNYIDEAKICFSRGILCILFRCLPFNRAVWIYKKILRQNYP